MPASATGTSEFSDEMTASNPVDVGAIDIRPLHSIDECQAAVALQREVWGQDFTDIVPAKLLQVVGHVGGLAAGAFDASGTLLGFVFGVNGVRGGELVHWSHLLGVRESARNLGLGRRLKEFQRDTLAAVGIRRILWTFDPLMAKNAHFNFNRLGAEVVDYVPDMYGPSTSPLHLGLATDRLIVSVRTAPHARRPFDAPLATAPRLTAFPRLDDITMAIGDRSPETALIEIPEDVLGVVRRSSQTARTWRLAVRDHFQWALSHGYVVTGVHHDAEAGRVFYVIARGSLTSKDERVLPSTSA